jgi:hypothetical protein
VLLSLPHKISRLHFIQPSDSRVSALRKLVLDWRLITFTIPAQCTIVRASSLAQFTQLRINHSVTLVVDIYGTNIIKLHTTKTMVASANGSAKPSAPTLAMTSSMNGRFQLPALKPVTFSLTAGTDIPPPPDSPIEETKPELPRTVTPPAEKEAAQPELLHPPNSPTSTTHSGRPSSIRRFLSLRSLNGTYNNPTDSSSDSRPQSPSAQSSASTATTLGKKKSWFMRVRKAEGTTSIGEMLDGSKGANGVAPERKGPPPPQLPQVKTETGSLFGDDDVFGRIK